jgi:hypothetical protein
MFNIKNEKPEVLLLLGTLRNSGYSFIGSHSNTDSFSYPVHHYSGTSCLFLTGDTFAPYSGQYIPEDIAEQVLFEAYADEGKLAQLEKGFLQLIDRIETITPVQLLRTHGDKLYLDANLYQPDGTVIYESIQLPRFMFGSLLVGNRRQLKKHTNSFKRYLWGELDTEE